MPSKPTIKDRQEVENWINAGKQANRDNIFLIRPANGKGGRSSPGQWIPIYSSASIPSGQKYLLRRSQDNESLYVELDDGSPGQQLSTEVHSGEILDSQEREIRNGIITLNAIDQAVETSAKSVRMAKESMDALEAQRSLVTASMEETSKAEMFKGFTLLAQRAFDLLSVRLRSPDDIEGKREFEKFLSLKSHLITQAGVDVAEISAGDLANLLHASKDPRVQALLSEIKQQKIKDLAGGSAASLSSEQ